MTKNLKSGWRTTLVGVIILLSTLGYILISQSVDYWVFATGLVFGILLLFSPDTLLQKIKKYFNFNKLNKED